MVGGENGQAVARTDDETTADDHVAVAIAIRSSTKREAGTRVGQRGDQLGGIDRVGIRMPTPEIGQRRAVDHRANGSTETAFQNRPRIGTGHCVHGVETHAKVGAGEQAAMRSKSNSDSSSSA
jgi:hypothetical protein